MGKYGLDNYDYDNWLADRGKHKEVRERHVERKSKDYSGWHWGLGDKPVKVRDKEELKRELDKRGLVLRDDVKKPLDI
ncbi:hypothetical protein LCGC14_0619960 [marine sediment metagenome]|uniref:Uncharacterized protein n=1 Tax=marine sediment metagenome TaxID=412755 RepID=A0A0F9RA37_9ZZZZ